MILNRIRLVFVLMVFWLSYCCTETPAKPAGSQIRSERPQEYSEVTFNLKSDYESAHPYLKVSTENRQFFLQFVEDRTYARFYDHQKLVKNWQPVIYNFNYNSSFKDAEKQIRIITGKQDGYLLLPEYSEEFDSFSVYFFSQSSFNFIQSIELPQLLNQPYKIFATGDSNPQFVAKLKNGQKVDFVKRDAYPIDTGTVQEDLRWLTETSTSTGQIKAASEKSNLIQKLTADLNADGVPDDLYALKSGTADGDFEAEHFNLEFKIEVSDNGRKPLTFNNSGIKYSNSGNCIAEGFSQLVAKQNYFTLEGQTCYDYNILVSSYLTFKVVNNDILLHRYSEEYYDKANHEKEIPARSWTQKDFGKMRFQDVTEDFLFRLRNK